MDDLISRKALVEKIKSRMENPVRAEDFSPGYARALLDIMDAPTVAAEPVRHAAWHSIDLFCHICGECNWAADDRFDYCPHCGTRMDLEQETAHQKTQARQGFCGSDKPVSAHEKMQKDHLGDTTAMVEEEDSR